MIGPGSLCCKPLAIAAAMVVAMASIGVPNAALAQQADPREQAQDALRRGNHERARTILLEQLAREPRDADLLRRLASVEAASGDLPEALTVIDRAAAIAPRDLDIRLARANILFWNGAVEDARAEADAIARIDPAYPELDQLQARLRPSPTRSAEDDRIGLQALYLSAGLSRIAFDGRDTHQTWTNQGAALGLRLGRVGTATFSVEREARARSDTRFAARFDRRIDGGSYYLEAGFVPDPDFRETWKVAVGGQAALAPNIDGSLDLRVADYATGTIVVAEPGVRVALTPRWSLDARAINLFGGNEGHRIGGSGRLAYEAQSGPTAFVSLATYPDAETDGVRQLRSAAIGLAWPVARNVTISAIGVHEDREDSYRRNSLTVVFARRFGPQ